MKLIRLLTVSNLFALEVVESCQHCQLCVLWENSIVLEESFYFVQALQVNQEEVIIIKNNGAMSQKNSVVANSLKYQQFQRTRFNKTICIIASDFKVRNIKFYNSVHQTCLIRG